MKYHEKLEKIINILNTIHPENKYDIKFHFDGKEWRCGLQTSYRFKDEKSHPNFWSSVSSPTFEELPDILYSKVLNEIEKYIKDASKQIDLSYEKYIKEMESARIELEKRTNLLREFY